MGAWLLAGHNAELAACRRGGAVPLLVLCVQEPSSLKRIAASSLSDIAKHSPEMAQAVGTPVPSRTSVSLF